MEPKDTPNKVEEQGQSKLIVANNQLKKVKSDYFIQKFFGYMPKRKSLETVRYNKSIQKRININIKKEDKKFIHIYFNNNKKKEIENTSFNRNDNVSKISIIIDYQIKSFSKLFYYCGCIESFEFKKFCRNNVTDMNCMFRECSSLKELNLNNFNTNNVTNMSCMFRGCSDDLRRKIKSENKNIKNEAFNN